MQGLKRLRSLHGRPDQYQLKQVMMKHLLGILFTHWSRWTALQTGPRQHQLKQKITTKATMATTTREQRPPQPSTPVVLAPPHHGT